MVDGSRARRDARFNGARSIDRDERLALLAKVGDEPGASMGPGRLTGMNAEHRPVLAAIRDWLQWGPVD